VFDSSGPEGKVRGTPQQIIEKYTQLARDAQLSNDRVAAENFQQHAEHYTRMLGEAQREAEARREQQEQQQQQQQQNRQDGGRNNERQGRQDKADAGQQNGNQGGQQPSGESAPVDVIDSDTPEESGLVETPEARSEQPQPEGGEKPAKAEKPKRARKPRAKKDGGNGGENAGRTEESQSPSEAAE
jgi:hypothetical protein